MKNVINILLALSLLTFSSMAISQETTSVSEVETLINQFLDDDVDTSDFSLQMKIRIEQYSDQAQSYFRQLGSLRSVTYEGTEHGVDVYLATFTGGIKSIWQMVRGPDGKVVHLIYNQI